MVRAVFDPNVLVSAVLSRSGAAAQLVAAWNQGRFELVVTPMLLDELTRVSTYTRIASRVAEADAAAYIALLRSRAHHVGDPDSPPPMACSDPNDDYLIAAAHASASMLVTGDAALLALADRIPVLAPRDFFDSLQHQPR